MLFSALKSLYIEGGISSTTTNVQHPPGWCDGSHIAPERPPHTSLLVETVMKPIGIYKYGDD